MKHNWIHKLNLIAAALVLLIIILITTPEAIFEGH